MIVTVDNTGMARIVDFDASTKVRMRSNLFYRLFTERSRDAVLNSKCSTLSIPSNMLFGTEIQFSLYLSLRYLYVYILGYFYV